MFNNFIDFFEWCQSILLKFIDFSSGVVDVLNFRIGFGSFSFTILDVLLTQVAVFLTWKIAKSLVV